MVNQIIAVSQLDTPEHIHELMASVFELPSYYGSNFDALYDVLTDISKRTVIAVDYEGRTLRELPDCTLTALRVMFDAALVNDDLTIASL